MATNNVGAKAIRFIVKDVVLDILLWPVWWYTTGLVEAFFRMIDTFKQANDEMALTVWVKNIFVPMYGDYSIQGRLISFFMRLVQIILRSIVVFGWFVFAIFLFVIWMVLPLFIVWQILYNLNLVIL